MRPTITQTVPTMYFLGVTTGQSSSREMFPVWAEILGLEAAQLVGVDLPIDAPADQYRQAVYQIKADPLSLGALVTTHKINVLRAASDYFDELTAEAELCQEVSCIYKRNGRLFGHAVDPKVSGQALGQFMPADYWTNHPAHILCLGAGGSGVALVTHFCAQAAAGQRPRRMILVDLSQDKLDNMARVIDRLPKSDIDFDLVCNSDPLVNDSLLADLPPYSMVINATGMGKDVPGSPITDNGYFPRNGIVWELNYRGDRGFLRQAEALANVRSLHVEDGWNYFLLGWSTVVATIFDLSIDQQLYRRLTAVAESRR